MARERMKTPAYIGCAVMMITGLAMAANSADTVKGAQLCREVRSELITAVEAGQMSMGEADQIISKCFELHASK